MNDIKAGPELDRAVAEAIGWTYRLADGPEGKIFGLECWHTPDGQQYYGYPPQSSTDLNAAFAAAEKAGLFEPKKLGAILSRVEVGWVVHWRGQGETAAFGDAPAIAICAAILMVKGYDFMAGRLDAMGWLERLDGK